MESSKDSLLKDFDGLNLSRYVAEVATAITEPKIKLADIPFMLRLCSLMYRRYSEFSNLLFEAWKKVFEKSRQVRLLPPFTFALIMFMITILSPFSRKISLNYELI